MENLNIVSLSSTQMKNVIFFQAGHFFFFLPFRFMFCIYISIWMGLHPIYTAAEAESSRYLDIYILIVCLSSIPFENDKINSSLRAKSTVHLHSGPADDCVWGPLEWSLADGWLVGCSQGEGHAQWQPQPASRERVRYHRRSHPPASPACLCPV